MTLPRTYGPHGLPPSCSHYWRRYVLLLRYVYSPDVGCYAFTHLPLPVALITLPVVADYVVVTVPFGTYFQLRWLRLRWIYVVLTLSPTTLLLRLTSLRYVTVR